MTDTIKNPEQGHDDLLDFEIADEALEAAAEKSKPAFTLIGAFEVADDALEAAAEKAKPAFTLIGSPTVSVLVACCG